MQNNYPTRRRARNMLILKTDVSMFLIRTCIISYIGDFSTDSFVVDLTTSDLSVITELLRLGTTNAMLYPASIFIGMPFDHHRESTSHC